MDRRTFLATVGAGATACAIPAVSIAKESVSQKVTGLPPVSMAWTHYVKYVTTSKEDGLFLQMNEENAKKILPDTFGKRRPQWTVKEEYEAKKFNLYYPPVHFSYTEYHNQKCNFSKFQYAQYWRSLSIARNSTKLLKKSSVVTYNRKDPINESLVARIAKKINNETFGHVKTCDLKFVMNPITAKHKLYHVLETSNLFGATAVVDPSSSIVGGNDYEIPDDDILVVSRKSGLHSSGFDEFPMLSTICIFVYRKSEMQDAYAKYRKTINDSFCVSLLAPISGLYLKGI